jgi:tyrosyl-tRNA synthetase
MRRIMDKSEIQNNANNFKKQFSKFIDFSDDKAIMVNNSEWLLALQYVPFLREYGVHFSVNRMLAMESYKARLEKGLTFFEFNYMLMQAYDFLELNRRYGCVMQMGGSDQWSNIIAGADLIRRVENKSAYGMTFKLLTRSDGQKMGKSQSGAVWLDPNKTTPYDFFQYWRNTDDADVKKFLSLLTFLPMDEINELCSPEGSGINKAKEVLAYEITKNVHSEEEAQKALEAARSLFSGAGDMSLVPSFELSKSSIGDGLNILDLLQKTKLAPSRSEARRLVEQGGVKIGGEKIDSIDKFVAVSDFKDGSILVQKGKKIFLKVNLA